MTIKPTGAGSPFTFVATTFVQPGYEQAEGDWSEGTKKVLLSFRSHYPELSHWGDLALGLAFGDFSQDVLEVSWAQWMIDKRDDMFLDYCCWRQTRGSWNYGLDSEELAKANEWKAAAAEKKTFPIVL